jgi:hypothetical protein
MCAIFAAELLVINANTSQEIQTLQKLGFLMGQTTSKKYGL